MTPGRPMSLASTHPSTVSQGQTKQQKVEMEGEEEDAAAALNQIERLLLCNIGITRMQDGGGKTLGPSSQLVLPSATVYEDIALQKAICTAGPAASLPKQPVRKWLHISAPQSTHGRWVQLPAPPLDASSATDDTARHKKSPGNDAEPTVSVYSRCRVLHLPAPEPALSIDVSAIAALAPAYGGEAFPVRVAVTNTHRLRKIARIEVSISVEAAMHADSHTAMSDLDVAGPDASSRTSLSNASAFRAVAVGTPPPPPPSSLLGALALGSESVFTARYVFSDEEEEKNGGARWNGQAIAQTSVPVVRPLAAYAEALALPAPCAASEDNWLLGQPIPVSLPATELSSSNEFCFRRPVVVTLVNRGPWAVAVEQMALQPPLIKNSALPLRVQLAATSAIQAEGESSSVVAANGGTLKHVFWLDIHTHDVIRMPTNVCVGMLEIHWRRAEPAAYGPLLQPQLLTRLWMPPLELVRKQVQVDMQTSSAVARVGRTLTVCYRVLNPTRVVQAVETAMHASDAFVFAGLRKTTLHVLPGHVGLLRFNMVPTIASQQQQQQQQRQTDPLPIEYAPGHAVLALATARKEKNRRTNPLAPQSNVVGLGWTLLPRLDVRIADASDDGESPQPAPNHPARGIFSPSIPPPPFPAPPPPPPPPPSASHVSLAAQDGLEAMTLRAQKTIIALAGLEVPEGDDWPKNLLSPELARSCLDMLPNYFVRTLDEADAESDVDSDAEDLSEDIARSTSIDIPTEDNGGDA
ncbi:Trafficking protein particle complex subunit 11, partial [Coemansia sp. IMI 209127]